MALTKVSTGVVDMSGNTGGLVIAKGTEAQRPASPSIGMIRESTETTPSKVEVYTDNGGSPDWQFLEEAGTSIVPLTLEYLVVAGGGGGNYGGGGAGGYLTNIGGSAKLLSTSAVYTVTVGAGGSLPTPNGNYPAGPGGQSIISESGTAFATTDGGGGGPSSGSGASGGSGSGAGYSSPTGGSASGVGIGNAGGSGGACYGGGGGGAGAPGASQAVSGDGGDGLQNNITGTNLYYAGGGGSLRNVSCSGTPQGGQGGGGNGGTSTSGVAGTNGLGGGGGARTVGGSGVVILRYTDSYTLNISASPTPVNYTRTTNPNGVISGVTIDVFTCTSSTSDATLTLTFS